MTKRKDKKAPVKISAAQKVEEKPQVDQSVTQEVVIEEAQTLANADEIVVEEEKQQEEVEQEKASVEETKPTKEKKSNEKDKKTDKNSKKPKKEKKERKGLKRRAKETVSELKKVTWPTFPEVVKRTGVVLAVVVIFAIVILALDLLLGLASSALMGNPFNPFKPLGS